MNIFVTDPSPIISARNLDDKRIIKMIAESCQILCTALHCKGLSDVPVRATHVNHPVSVWARSTRQNYLWLLDHFMALCEEKRKRYPNNRPHEYEKHYQYLLYNAKYIPSLTQTKFVNCAQNASLNVSYKHVEDTATAYQLYLSDRWETDKRAPTWYGISR